MVCVRLVRVAAAIVALDAAAVPFVSLGELAFGIALVHRVARQARKAARPLSSREARRRDEPVVLAPAYAHRAVREEQAREVGIELR